MKDYKNLQVWSKGHGLALEIYRATQVFPQHELYGLSSQMRRASVSIPSNSAEGCGRNTNSELVRFIDIAMGSGSELEYQLLLVHDLGYLTAADFAALDQQTSEVRRMLNALIHKIRGEIGT